MKYIYNEGKSDKTFLLLHGTGGTETDLLPIANYIDKDANVLAFRGGVSENGMARFFKRLSEGVFDEEDLIMRTKEMQLLLDELADKYQFDRKKIIAIGYSNGANIAASLLFHYEASLNGAILHHPMVPIRDKSLPNLANKQIFIGAGKNDPLCSPEESVELKEMLEVAGAKVSIHWESNGHQLTQTEISAAKGWYDKIYK